MNVPHLLLELEQHLRPWSDPPLPWEAVLADLAGLIAARRVRREGCHMSEASDAKIAALADKFDLDPAAVRAAAVFDPTPNGVYLAWLMRHATAGAIDLSEDGETVRDQLAQFHALKAKSTYTGEKDINKMDPGGLWDLLQDHAGTVGKKEKTRIAAAKGIRRLAEADGYQVWEVSTPEAAAKAFRNTNWCVKDPKYFAHYKPPVYHMVVAGDQPVALLHRASGQFRRTNDKNVELKAALPYLACLKVAGVLIQTLDDCLHAMVSEQEAPVVVALSALQFMSPERLRPTIVQYTPVPTMSAKAAKAAGQLPPLMGVAGFKARGRAAWEAEFLALSDEARDSAIEGVSNPATLTGLANKSPVAAAAVARIWPRAAEQSPFSADPNVRAAIIAGKRSWE